MTVALRALALGLALLGFFAIGVPVQQLASARGWRLAGRIPVFFSRTLCRLLRISVHTHGRVSAGGGSLVVANHVSWTDILVLGISAPMSFLAKSEVAGWPLLGAFARAQATVFVDRQHKSCIPQVNAGIADAIRQGRSVVLFPEATTSDGTRIKPFFSSHFAAAIDAQVTIQPVAILYARRDGLPLGRAGRAALAWYGDMALLPHVLALLRGGLVDCYVIFADPIAGARTLDRKSLARAAEMAIREALRAARSGRGVENSLPAKPPEAKAAVLLRAKTA